MAVTIIISVVVVDQLKQIDCPRKFYGINAADQGQNFGQQNIRV
jgi:hypothetical protein